MQGLADSFLKMRLPFDSPEARKLNEDIFEALYFSAVTTSCALAEEKGTYQTFKNSPASKGMLQFDLWGEKPSKKYDWVALKAKVKTKGLRNSLLVAPMPTASTSQILGNNECFEPYTSNIYVRRVLSGEFIVVNKYLVKDLHELGMWNTEIKDKIIANNGSIQHVQGIPKSIKALYRTVWEISQKSLIDMAADRGKYICQSQSLNLFMQDPVPSKLSSMHFYAWKKGLKTGLYYLRTQAAAKAVQFTIAQKAGHDPQNTPTEKAISSEGAVCELNSEGAEGCDVCSA